jgi:hypothetical protein
MIEFDRDRFVLQGKKIKIPEENNFFNLYAHLGYS